MNPPQVSVVVCTHNRATMLRDALESLAALETAERFRFEIVVIDNASTDATAEIVHDVERKTSVPVRYVYEGKKGIATARNRGIRESSGEWIAFFDDDQLATRRWLAELYAYANEYNVLAVGGPVHLKLPPGCHRDLHPFIRMLLGESQLSEEPFCYSPKVSPGTGNLMLHRCVFECVGNFNEAFAVRAEDTDLFCRLWRAGIETWYVPSALVHHVTRHERLELAYLNRLASFMGDGIANREREMFPLRWFALRSLAKNALCPAAICAKLAWAIATRNTEMQLGLRCQLRLALQYAQSSFGILRRELIRLAPKGARRSAAPTTDFSTADLAKRNA